MDQGLAEAAALVRQGWNHLQLQRPLAAWACWQRVLQSDPDDKAALQALAQLETLEELPAAARAVYRFQNPADPARRARWNDVLRSQNLAHLEDAARTFRSLAQADLTDADAELNFALCLAWLGQNAEAIEVLERVVSLLAETVPERASDAWMLAEVLRLGAGAEHLADDLRGIWTLSEPDLPDADLYQRWPDLMPIEIPIDPLTGIQAIKTGQIYEWLDRPVIQGGDIRGAEVPRKLASVMRTNGLLRLSSPDPTTFVAMEASAFDEIAFAFRPARREISPLPISWADAAISTFRIPGDLDPQRRDELTREVVERYHESIWIQQPRHALGGLTPVQAARRVKAGDAVVEAKLHGIIRFREQLSMRATHRILYQGYPFDRLRRRLELLGPDANPAALDPLDISCMSESELQQLDPATLDDSRLIEALESASPFIDDDRSGLFARDLLSRKPALLKRIPPDILIAPLVRLALKSANPDETMQWLEDATVFYDETDRTTVQIWRAEVLARSGQPEAAHGIYQSFVDSSHPNATRIVFNGAEMLRDSGYPEWADALLDPEKAV